MVYISGMHYRFVLFLLFCFSLNVGVTGNFFILNLLCAEACRRDLVTIQTSLPDTNLELNLSGCFLMKTNFVVPDWRMQLFASFPGPLEVFPPLLIHINTNTHAEMNAAYSEATSLLLCNYFLFLIKGHQKSPRESERRPESSTCERHLFFRRRSLVSV